MTVDRCFVVGVWEYGGGSRGGLVRLSPMSGIQKFFICTSEALKLSSGHQMAQHWLNVSKNWKSDEPNCIDQWLLENIRKTTVRALQCEEYCRLRRLSPQKTSWIVFISAKFQPLASWTRSQSRLRHHFCMAKSSSPVEDGTWWNFLCLRRMSDGTIHFQQFGLVRLQRVRRWTIISWRIPSLKSIWLLVVSPLSHVHVMGANISIAIGTCVSLIRLKPAARAKWWPMFGAGSRFRISVRHHMLWDGHTGVC